MILIVGLGNPGGKFEKTRHNVGFRVIDGIAANFQFSIFNFQSIFNAQISKGKINEQKVILVKPKTFMNNSGIAVKKIIKNSKLRKIKNLIVIHDDIDLQLGKIRISKDRGPAGHKGVKSIIRELKTRNFVRFRVGIKNQELRIKNVEQFVLQKFAKNEEKTLKEIIKKTIEAVEFVLKEGLEKTMTKYNY